MTTTSFAGDSAVPVDPVDAWLSTATCYYDDDDDDTAAAADDDGRGALRWPPASSTPTPEFIDAETAGLTMDSCWLTPCVATERRPDPFVDDLGYAFWTQPQQQSGDETAAAAAVGRIGMQMSPGTVVEFDGFLVNDEQTLRRSMGLLLNDDDGFDVFRSVSVMDCHRQDDDDVDRVDEDDDPAYSSQLSTPVASSSPSSLWSGGSVDDGLSSMSGSSSPPSVGDGRRPEDCIFSSSASPSSLVLKLHVKRPKRLDAGHARRETTSRRRSRRSVESAASPTSSPDVVKSSTLVLSNDVGACPAERRVGRSSTDGAPNRRRSSGGKGVVAASVNGAAVAPSSASTSGDGQRRSGAAVVSRRDAFVQVDDLDRLATTPVVRGLASPTTCSVRSVGGCSDLSTSGQTSRKQGEWSTAGSTSSSGCQAAEQATPTVGHSSVLELFLTSTVPLQPNKGSDANVTVRLCRSPASTESAACRTKAELQNGDTGPTAGSSSSSRAGGGGGGGGGGAGRTGGGGILHRLLTEQQQSTTGQIGPCFKKSREPEQDRKLPVDQRDRVPTADVQLPAADSEAADKMAVDDSEADLMSMICIKLDTETDDILSAMDVTLKDEDALCGSDMLYDDRWITTCFDDLFRL